MKYYYSFLFFLVFVMLGISQNTEECYLLNDEITNPPNTILAQRVFKNKMDFEPVTFRIFFWGVKLNNNTGNVNFTEENVINGVRFLNELYNQCNIFFELVGMDTILSSQFYKLNNPGDFFRMLNVFRGEGFERKDAFNVYVSNEYSGFGGIAEAYFSSTIGIPVVQLIHPGTIQHEIGHAFNLLHTNNESDTIFGCESAIRDPNNQYYNADITGDFVSDTAAGFPFSETDIDPVSCTLTFPKSDCYGYTYDIPSSLLRNYMTISAPACEKDQLTNGQFLRIRQAIEFDRFGDFHNATIY